MNKLVQMRNVTKVFPGVKALDNVTFDIGAGEVHVLLGENGAGKSTLMKILSGVYKPTDGEIIINGKTFTQLSTLDSYTHGISVIYQELSVINELSIMENLFVGKLPVKKKFGIELVDYEKMKAETTRVLDKIGLKKNPKTLVEELSISEKQQCEIAKALVSNSQVIIMDEPTTSLTISETDHLFSIIRALKKEGKGIVYISHKMDEIKKIGDRVTVLKDGQTVGTKDIKDVTVEQLIKMMVGREIFGTYFNTTGIDLAKEPVIFEVNNITRKDLRVQDISFEVHKGEILGFSGLVGSGRSELMNAIFGSEPKINGKIKIMGKEVDIKSPYDSIKNGLAMVTENRRETGFLNNFSIKQNISIVPFLKKSKLQGTIGMLDFNKENAYADKFSKKLKIKCANVNQNIVELSGGNQQKVILAKWLAAKSKVIIFDEPTKGIDIGSKSEFYILMRELANEGKGVIMISSEMNELLSVCDRICVFKDGQIKKEFSSAEATEEKILKVSTGE